MKHRIKMKKNNNGNLFQMTNADYETIFNSTHDVISLYDIGPDGQLIYHRLNKSHERITGLTTAQVYGKTPREVFGDQMRYLEAESRRCIEAQETIIFEETILLPNGKVTVWSTLLSPVIREGKVKQVVGSRRDIAELKRTSEALRESEQRYSSLFENSHCVMLIIDPSDGRIVEANPAACQYYGYSHQTLKELTISQINILAPEQVQQEMRRAIAEHRNQFFFRHRLASGEIRDVEVFSSPVDIGEKPMLFSIIHDIVDRKQAEAKLYEEKERLNVTLHSIGDAVLTTDTAGRVTLMNEVAEQLMGWKAREAIGQPLKEVFQIINEHTREVCVNPVEKVLETGIVVELANHTALIAKDGAEHRIADSGAPIRDKEGNILGVVLVFRDVTEQKEREDAIKFLNFHDNLTGLYNRAFFEEELRRIDQTNQLPLSLIIGDVNGLKLANDIFGHYSGDKLLIKIANILTEVCNPNNIIARWGGDEFAVILPRTSNQAALEVCEQIKRRCGREPKEPLQLSIALGTSTKESSAQDINLVLKDAEDLMYRHKLLEGKSVRNSLIASLEKTLFERNLETEEHAQRLLNIASKLAAAMGLSSSETDELKLLAILHDIGKIGVPDGILLKPGGLTPEEWREMQKHPEIGCRIAQSSPELSHIADLILSHHERWDGTGYPRGLQGDQIPKLARIISIIDTYDVMTHSRPYKEAVSHEEAIKEIIRCSGRQFDPEITQVFVRIF